MQSIMMSHSFQKWGNIPVSNKQYPVCQINRIPLKPVLEGWSLLNYCSIAYEYTQIDLYLAETGIGVAF